MWSVLLLKIIINNNCGVDFPLTNFLSTTEYKILNFYHMGRLHLNMPTPLHCFQFKYCGMLTKCVNIMALYTAK